MRFLLFVAPLALLGLTRFPPPLLDNGVARTPPMGWNSWNHLGCDVSAQLIRETADAMAANGLRDAGYQYVVIDDCWQVARDARGRLVADSVRFPGGMKPLADYVHAKGLKFGIYTDAGRRTCQGRPGTYGSEDVDARTFAEWGVDYIKEDWCYAEGLDAPTQYAKFRDALAQAGRPIVFSICEWGSAAHCWQRPTDYVSRDARHPDEPRGDRRGPGLARRAGYAGRRAGSGAAGVDEAAQGRLAGGGAPQPLGAADRDLGVLVAAADLRSGPRPGPVGACGPREFHGALQRHRAGARRRDAAGATGGDA